MKLKRDQQQAEQNNERIEAAIQRQASAQEEQAKQLKIATAWREWEYKFPKMQDWEKKLVQQLENMNLQNFVKFMVEEAITSTSTIYPWVFKNYMNPSLQTNTVNNLSSFLNNDADEDTVYRYIYSIYIRNGKDNAISFFNSMPTSNKRKLTAFAKEKYKVGDLFDENIFIFNSILYKPWSWDYYTWKNYQRKFLDKKRAGKHDHFTQKEQKDLELLRSQSETPRIQDP